MNVQPKNSESERGKENVFEAQHAFAYNLRD